MKLHKIIFSILLSFCLFNIAIAANSQDKQSEEMIRNYILKHPEVLVQSLEMYQQQQISQTKQTFEKIQNTAPKFADRLFHQGSDPVGGNPNGKITIVEFSDYQCPHCIEMTSTLEDLVKKNNNLRIIFKEFPIRGPSSELATRAALAAQKQGKYYEIHNALMQSKTQPLTEAVILDIAKANGLNVEQLKKDMQDKSIDQKIQENYQLAKDMQLMWTPIFFIAKTDVNNSAKPQQIIFIPGRVESAQLLDAISKINQ